MLSASFEGSRSSSARTIGPTIDLTFDIPDDVWDILIDPNQLENALLNLCINARDAMPDGGRLEIRAKNAHLEFAGTDEPKLPAGDYVDISVSDTGTGMSKEVLERAFEPLFTTKPVGEGTGLGLSMIYSFTRQSGGKVWNRFRTRARHPGPFAAAPLRRL